jgi:hypothetical protein
MVTEDLIIIEEYRSVLANSFIILYVETQVGII